MVAPALTGAANAEAAFGTSASECTTASQAIAGRSLDEIYSHSWRAHLINLRGTYTHLIEEYARHNGHADLLREQTDGVTGE